MFRRLQNLRIAQERDRRRFGRFFGAIAVFLVIVLIFSVVYIGVHSGKKEEVEVVTDEDGSVVTTEEAPEVSGVKNLLLFCTNTEKTSLRFISVIQINFGDNTYTISSFSPRETVNTNGRFATFVEHYQSGGVKQLVRAVEKISGITIDRYIGSDDNSFKRAINSVGAVTMNFPEQINYRGEDFSIVLIKGEQKLRGDDLLKYMRYCGAVGDDGLRMQSEVIGELFKQYITEKTMAKCDNLYSSLINVLRSDITVMDFKKFKDELVYMQVVDFEVNCIQYFRIIKD